MQAQLDRGKHGGKRPQDTGQPFWRDHDIDREIDFGFQPAQQAFDLGAEPIDP